MLRFLTCLALLALPQTALAECGGQNILPTLSSETRSILETAADAQPYGKGLLWQAKKGEREIILFGSFHLAHDFTTAHKERLLPLAQAADVTYFEMNADDMQRFEQETRSNPDLMFIDNNQPTLPSLLTDAEWTDLSAKMQARGFPPFIAAKLKPMFVSMMLGMSPCKMREMQTGEHGIDRVLAEELRQKGLASRSIEDYRTAAKLFDAFSSDKQIELLRLSLINEVSPDDMMETMYQAYIAEEIALIWEYSKMLSLEEGGADAEADFALFEKLLLTARNEAWIEELRDAAEQRILVVVGAAHLGGASGVLKLLENEGYEIIRLNL